MVNIQRREAGYSDLCITVRRNKHGKFVAY
jgi:hypothetical protein